jgi:transposase
MFLRCHKRKKNGKLHRYWSVVEARRLAGGRSSQRQVLYLGEINSSQQSAWQKTIRVFDEQRQEYRELSLFPDDQVLEGHQVDALPVKLSEMRLHRPRSFGDCWLGCLLWEELGLGGFWQDQLGGDSGGVAWEKVLRLLAVNRLCEAGSEFAVHRQWFLRSAMDQLLEVDYAVADKDRLYRVLDRILPHREALCRHLVERWQTLFDAKFDVLLYDLTSTYFEGSCDQIPMAKHGYSRDGRPDCRQVVVALVVTTEGLPLAYEVLPGNTLDKTTLKGFLGKIEGMYGKARRVWVMDRGIPTEEALAKMREEGVAYLVGTPKSLLNKKEQAFADKSWEQVQEGVKVKLIGEDHELYVLAQSMDRRNKENAMRRRKLKALVRGLNRIKRKETNRDRLIGRVAVLKKEAGRVACFIKVLLPKADEAVNRQTFRCVFDRMAWKQAMERDGSYILRASIPWEDFGPEVKKQAPILWQWYIQLVHVEEAFKTLKSDLNLRPIHHQLQHRVEAHILVAFLGYCLTMTLKMKLQAHAPGLSPRAVLQSLSAIQMMDVEVPTTDGRCLVMPRYTEPEAQQQMILQKLRLKLPAQPPPRIRAGQIELPAGSEAKM